MKKVFISGAAGFGGSGLAKALLERGHTVTAYDITAPLHAEELLSVRYNEKFRYHWGSLQDIQPEHVADHDVVVHLAASADVPLGFPAPLWNVEQNVVGTVCLLEACRRAIEQGSKIQKIFDAGSGNEWGRPLYTPIDEKHPLTPHNPYSFSKASQELAFWAWHRCYGLPVVIMSNGVVIGPNMRREIFIFKWLWEIAHGQPIKLEGGDQTRDITYVGDVLDAWVKTIEAPASEVVGEKFQVSYGEEHSVEEIMHWCIDESKSNVEVIQTPHRPGEKGQREYFDNSKARKVLGYNPQVGPREAIHLTWKWMQEKVL